MSENKRIDSAAPVFDGNFTGPPLGGAPVPLNTAAACGTIRTHRLAETYHLISDSVSETVCVLKLCLELAFYLMLNYSYIL